MNKGRPREGNQEKGIAKQSKEGSGVKEESSLFIEIEKFLSERVCLPKNSFGFDMKMREKIAFQHTSRKYVNIVHTWYDFVYRVNIEIN